MSIIAAGNQRGKISETFLWLLETKLQVDLKKSFFTLGEK